MQLIYLFSISSNLLFIIHSTDGLNQPGTAPPAPVTEAVRTTGESLPEKIVYACDFNGGCPDSFARIYYFDADQRKQQCMCSLDVKSPGSRSTFLASDAEQLKLALRTALDAGYRYIDTAYRYRNEAVIGEVLQEYYDAGKLKREDVFLTTKLLFYGHKNPEHFLKYSLNALRTSYIDLYLLLHFLASELNAAGDDFEEVEGKPVRESIPLIDTWRFFEQEYKAGTLKSVGISNFTDARSRSYMIRQRLSRTICRQLNKLQYLDNLNNLSTDIDSSNGATRRFHHPKSTNPSRVLENINIFDFEISPEDMHRFETDVKEHKQLFNFEFLQHHPWFPWNNNGPK
uniref:NADP-dependent oxidoreductase domain-containing protein n=1 Tax=Ditylenchus dipsaci TaxID=166011 RepID=A0A915D1A2_9BILA